MKKFILCGFVFATSVTSVISHAGDEIKLKRSCLKDYPEVVGESNPELLSIYSQLCDKKNKDNKNSFLIMAAQKFQQMGKNNKAIQIVSYLETQNIQSNELTDVKFLSGIGLAHDALNKMRNNEMRYLTEDVTYPVAKSFSEEIKHAAPSSVLVEKQQEVNTNIVKTSKQTRSTRYVRPTKSVRKAVAPTKSATPAKSKPAATTSSASQNPFGKL
ncbi:hypothetical protein [uncultured Acinetobacter sp.]|uniref:hypothetical protein n=1 Tax=uncultured Acinetobacter sp. TaxID=165433 RepID=UPI0025E992ED|nr:hypothetical protein [uncultured Acinetobacter sp.]